MKKFTVLLAVLVLLMIPVSAFAGDGIWIGPTAMYNNGMTLGELIDNPPTDISPDDLTYGVEARVDFSIFQASVNAMYLANQDMLYSATNAGVYADLGIVGLGLTAGPMFLTSLDPDYIGESVELWSNVKAEADFILGDILFSAYYMALVEDLEGLADVNWDVEDPLDYFYGNVGVSVLFRL